MTNSYAATLPNVPATRKLLLEATGPVRHQHACARWQKKKRLINIDHVQDRRIYVDASSNELSNNIVKCTCSHLATTTLHNKTISGQRNLPVRPSSGPRSMLFMYCRLDKNYRINTSGTHNPRNSIQRSIYSKCFLERWSYSTAGARPLEHCLFLPLLHLLQLLCIHGVQ